ncbi:MAG: hypothetical protein AB7I59_15035 [Geminicoccaceae bacterium]
MLEDEAARALSELDEMTAAAVLERAQPGAGPMRPSESRAIPESAPSLEMVVAEGGPPIRIRCWPPAIAATLAAALAPLAAAGPARVCIDLFEDHAGPLLAVDGKVVHRPTTVAMGRWLLLRRLASEIAPDRRTLVCLHAAAIALPHGTVLLAGRSGSGKTTLAAGLVARGGALLADDLTPLEAGTRFAFAFPLAMSIKRGSWPVASSLFPGFGQLPEITLASTAVRYLPSPRRVAPGIGHKVVGLLFLRYAPGARASSAPVRPAAALRRLVESGTWPPVSADDLDDFLGWLADLPIHDLVYGDLDDGIRLASASL